MVFIQFYFLHAVHINPQRYRRTSHIAFHPLHPNGKHTSRSFLCASPPPPERDITFLQLSFKNRAVAILALHARFKKMLKNARKKKKKVPIKSTPSETWGNTISSCVRQQQMETLSPSSASTPNPPNTPPYPRTQKVKWVRGSVEAQSSSNSGQRRNLAAGSGSACFSWLAT